MADWTTISSLATRGAGAIHENGNVYLAMSLRNVGAGIGLWQGALRDESLRGPSVVPGPTGPR
jgi:hypothetical protein